MKTEQYYLDRCQQLIDTNPALLEQKWTFDINNLRQYNSLTLIDIVEALYAYNQFEETA